MEEGKRNLKKQLRIVVVGAGPAGISCTIQLCKAGFDVVLLDNGNFPRFKPGESCHPGIEPLLVELGVWDQVLARNFRRNRYYRIESDHGSEEKYYNEEKTWEGFQFPRAVFDSLLLKQACRLGVRFYPSVSVDEFQRSSDSLSAIVTKQGKIVFDYLIDASGRDNFVARKLHIGCTECSAKIISHYAQVNADQCSIVHQVPFFEIRQRFWGYIAPISDSLYSISYSGMKKDSAGFMSFIVSRLGTTARPVINKGYETSWKIASRPPFRNLYSIGDAFLTFDPTSSKGILKGIMSGMYVAGLLRNVRDGQITDCQGQDIYQRWGERFLKTEMEALSALLPVGMSHQLFNCSNKITFNYY